MRSCNDRARFRWQADLLPVLCNPLVILLPGDQLLAIVSKLVAATDTHVSRLQLPHQLRKYADLKMPTIEPVWLHPQPRLPGHYSPPCFWNPGEVQRGPCLRGDLVPEREP